MSEFRIASEYSFLGALKLPLFSNLGASERGGGKKPSDRGERI